MAARELPYEPHCGLAVTPAPVPDPAEKLFPGGSEMARRMREHDWASSPLGDAGSVAGEPADCLPDRPHLRTSQRPDGEPVLLVTGEIDMSNAETFGTAIPRCLPDHGRLVVDLTAVDYVDTAG